MQDEMGTLLIQDQKLNQKKTQRAKILHPSRCHMPFWYSAQLAKVLTEDATVLGQHVVCARQQSSHARCQDMETMATRNPHRAGYRWMRQRRTSRHSGPTRASQRGDLEATFPMFTQISAKRVQMAASRLESPLANRSGGSHRDVSDERRAPVASGKKKNTNDIGIDTLALPGERADCLGVWLALLQVLLWP